MIVKCGKTELSKSSLAFLGAALLLFLVRAVWTLYLELGRASPLAADDVYGYIVKAAQIQGGCFWQNCQALLDLRGQLTAPQADVESAFLMGLNIHRILVVYHPLHSVLLIALNAVIGGWITSYVVLELLIIGVLSAAICWFLWETVGQKAATFALIVLSSSMFQGHGINGGVPSTLTLALALFSWTLCIKYGKASLAPNSLLVVAMLLSHPIGKMYAAILLFVYAWQYWRELKAPQWTGLGCIAALVAVTALSPKLISAPLLSWELGVGNYWLDLKANVAQAYGIVKKWDARPSFGTAAAVVVYGAALYSAIFYFRCYGPIVKKISVILFAIAIVSLSVVLTNYPAEVFSRAWIPLAVCIAGAAGHGFHRLSEDIQKKKKAFVVTIPYMAVFLIFVGGLTTYIKTAALYMGHLNTDINFQQPTIAGSLCGTMFYSEQVAATFYLSHDTLHCRSVFLPALDAVTLSSADLPAPSLVVARKPGTEELRLERGSEIVIHLRGGRSMAFRIRTTAAADVTIQMRGLSTTREIATTLHAGWNAISIEDDIAEVSFKTSTDKAYTTITGLRMHPKQVNDWPWGLPVALEHKYLARVTYEFDSRKISRGLFERLVVLDERGWTALLCVSDESGVCSR